MWWWEQQQLLLQLLLRLHLHLHLHQLPCSSLPLQWKQWHHAAAPQWGAQERLPAAPRAAAPGAPGMWKAVQAWA